MKSILSACVNISSLVYSKKKSVNKTTSEKKEIVSIKPIYRTLSSSWKL